MCVQAFFESQGLTYTADGIIGNTFNSHRLVVYAGKQSLAKQWEVMSLLFKAFFVDVRCSTLTFAASCSQGSFVRLNDVTTSLTHLHTCHCLRQSHSDRRIEI
jgi:hypothetical protein